MRNLPWWTVFVVGVGLASSALTYWVMASAPWLPQRVAALGAAGTLLIYSLALLYLRHLRRVHSASPPAEGAPAPALPRRSSTYTMAGSIVLLLGNVCLVPGAYWLYQGDLHMSILGFSVAGGLVSLAWWLIKGGVPR